MCVGVRWACVVEHVNLPNGGLGRHCWFLRCAVDNEGVAQSNVAQCTKSECLGCHGAYLAGRH